LPPENFGQDRTGAERLEWWTLFLAGERLSCDAFCHAGPVSAMQAAWMRATLVVASADPVFLSRLRG